MYANKKNYTNIFNLRNITLPELFIGFQKTP